MTKNTALDFQFEYLFRTCSATTNLVRSLKFNLIRCATMLCIFGQLRNGSVVIHFLLCGSNATSTATGDYVAVPERFGQNEVGSNEERTINSPVFFPKVDINVAKKLQKCDRDFPFFFAFCFFLVDEFYLS